MMYNLEKDYSTSDMGIAAYLLVAGYDLLGMRHGERKSLFVFPEKARNAAEEYWMEKTRVHPREMLDALRTLKARLKNERENIPL